MPIDVVDPLEVIEVEQDQRDRLTGTHGPAELHIDEALELHPVPGAGERVRRAQAFEFGDSLLQPLVFLSANRSFDKPAPGGLPNRTSGSRLVAQRHFATEPALQLRARFRSPSSIRRETIDREDRDRCADGGDRRRIVGEKIEQLPEQLRIALLDVARQLVDLA